MSEYAYDETVATFEKREYTGLGELCWVYRDGETATYRYRPDGLRFSKTIAIINGEAATTVHHWNGQSMVLETAGGWLVKIRFLRGVVLIAQQIGGELHWYLHNAHGDVSQLTDSNQVLLSDYETDAFGVEREPNPLDPNPMRYCGEYLDSETGQIYLRNRYYDPATGRFTSEDPVRSGANWYSYCGGNPLAFVDPLGLAARSTGRPWVDRALGGRSPEEGLSWGAYEHIYNSGVSSGKARNDPRTRDVYDQWRSGRSSSRAGADARAYSDWASSRSRRLMQAGSERFNMQAYDGAYPKFINTLPRNPSFLPFVSYGYDTMDEAAMAWARMYNPYSLNILGYEFSSAFYMAEDYKYHFTVPVQGGATESPVPGAPNPYRTAGYIHSHPPIDGAHTEIYSPGDINIFQNSGYKPNYIVTAGGTLQKLHDEGSIFKREGVHTLVIHAGLPKDEAFARDFVHASDYHYFYPGLFGSELSYWK